MKLCSQVAEALAKPEALAQTPEMHAANGRLLLASVHDVSPRFEAEVDRLMNLLTPVVGSRIALLVVPNHWGDAPIIQASPFAAKLRGLANEGCEIFLHGFFHRDSSRHERLADRLRARFLTASEGEFLGLSNSEARQRICRGRDVIEDVIGRPIDGFVAPAWLYGRGALEAIEDLAVPIAESHWRVWSPAQTTELARGPVITWATRSRARRVSSLAAAAALPQLPCRVLRLGVHPPDIRDPATVKSISKTLALVARHRRIGRYRDLLTPAAA